MCNVPNPSQFFVRQTNVPDQTSYSDLHIANRPLTRPTYCPVAERPTYVADGMSNMTLRSPYYAPTEPFYVGNCTGGLANQFVPASPSIAGNSAGVLPNQLLTAERQLYQFPGHIQGYPDMMQYDYGRQFDLTDCATVPGNSYPLSPPNHSNYPTYYGQWQ